MPHRTEAARRDYQRGYRVAHRDKRREDGPDHDRARNANRRAKVYGVAGRITVADVRAILSIGRCHYCGNADTALGIDHVVGMHVGGLNVRGNIVACCHSCNARKWRKETPTQWSLKNLACTGCGRTDSRHVTGGLCVRCNSKERHQERRVLNETTTAFLERRGRVCAYCGEPAVHREHVVAKAMRQRHHIAYEDDRYHVPACMSCNLRKSTRHLYPPGFDVAILPGRGWQEWSGGTIPEVRR